MSDRMRQDAVIPKLEIIGEAVRHLSEETTQRRPDISWNRIAGMCNRLTHDYFGVDLALISLNVTFRSADRRSMGY